MGKQLMFLSEDNSSKMANPGLQIQNTAHQNSSWPFLSFIFVFLPEIDKLIPKLICRGMQATTTAQIIFQIKNKVRNVTFPRFTVYAVNGNENSKLCPEDDAQGTSSVSKDRSLLIVSWLSTRVLGRH